MSDANPSWLDAPVALFAHCKAAETSGHPTIADVLHHVRAPSTEHVDLIAKIRAVPTKDEQNRLKQNLPAVTFAADLHHRKSETPLSERLISWSGVAVMDGDDLEKPDAIRDALKGDPFIGAAFVSPSGKGVKILVRFAHPDRFADCWRAAASYLKSVHGITADPAPKNPASLCFLSHDPDLWIADGEVLAFQPMTDETVQKPIESPKPAPTDGALRPGDDFNLRGILSALITHHGWTLHKDGPNQLWRRPGKDWGYSATYNGKVFYVFTSSAAPLQANTGYSPFAVLAHLEHGGDFAAAARALRSYNFGDKTALPSVPAAQITPIVSVDDSDDPPESDDPDDPGPVPETMLKVPGFVANVMNFCLETAPYPNPVMAFCGAMTLQGTLAGRKVRDEFDNRTNLYLLGLANSGAGKDRPRKVNQEIMLEVNLANQIGDAFASAEGIEDRMYATPTMLFQTDEMDSLLLAMRDGNDGRNERVMQSLLKFFSSANGIYPMRVKAGDDPLFINQPCLSIFGTAIAKHFYEALSSKMLSNGFVARMSILEPGKRGHGQRSFTTPVPPSILSVATWWSKFSPGNTGNLSTVNPKPLIVPFAPETLELIDNIRRQTEIAYDNFEAKNDQMGMAIWARATEKVHRFALTYACSVNHMAAMITPEAIQWAWKLVEHQTKRMIAMAKLHSYEGDFDQRQKKALQAIKAKGGMMSQEQLTKALRTIPCREREEVITNLVLTKQIFTHTEQTPGRPKTIYRLPCREGKS